MSFRDFIRYRMDIGMRGFSRTFSGRESELTLDDNGFTFQLTIFRFRAPEIHSTRVNWSEISQITALKEDNFTWDSLWLIFQLNDGCNCSVSEESIGWIQLLERLPQMVPGSLKQEDWWPRVIQPAFAPNVTQVYPAPT